MQSKKKIAIIGTGIGGLALAYFILKDHPEYSVIMLEKSDGVGGLAVPFEIQGTLLEKFYHHIFTTDTDIISLISSLGLDKKLHWYKDNRGTMYKGKIYPFTAPTDLLKFTPIPFLDRVRLAIVSFYVTRINNWKRLENKKADSWMRKYAGEKAYEVFWKPLLYGKFQERYKDITMSWLWSRLKTRINSNGKLGYLEDSFGSLFTTLSNEIIKRRGEILTGVNVTNIASEAGIESGVSITYTDKENIEKIIRVDKCIVTAPPQAYTKFIKGFSDEYIKRVCSIDYISAQTIILTLKNKLSNFYWISVADLDEPALVVVEQSNLIDVYNKKHVIYIGNYLQNNSAILSMNENELRDLFIPFLERINPDFKKEWIEEFRVFRAAFAQPIVTPEYHTKIPEFASPIKNIYILTMSQVYPEDRGMNYAIKNAKLLYTMLNL